MRLALTLLALVLAGCASAPSPQGTPAECARGLLPEPSLPYWNQVPEENWQAAIRACEGCMSGGDTSSTCSRRMWGK